MIRVVTSIVHRRLAPRHPAVRELWFDEQVWKADAEDLREIAQPASRLLARRLRVPAEAADTVAVLFGTAGYVEKNLDKDTKVRGLVDVEPTPMPEEQQ